MIWIHYNPLKLGTYLNHFLFLCSTIQNALASILFTLYNILSKPPPISTMAFIKKSSLPISFFPLNLLYPLRCYVKKRKLKTDGCKVLQYIRSNFLRLWPYVTFQSIPPPPTHCKKSLLIFPAGEGEIANLFYSAVREFYQCEVRWSCAALNAIWLPCSKNRPRWGMSRPVTEQDAKKTLRFLFLSHDIPIICKTKSAGLLVVPRSLFHASSFLVTTI